MNIIAVTPVGWWWPRHQLIVVVLLAVAGLAPQAIALDAAVTKTWHRQHGLEDQTLAAERQPPSTKKHRLQLQQEGSAPSRNYFSEFTDKVRSVAKGIGIITEPLPERKMTPAGMWIQRIVFWTSTFLVVAVFCLAHLRLWHAKHYPAADDLTTAYLAWDDESEGQDEEDRMVRLVSPGFDEDTEQQYWMDQTEPVGGFWGMMTGSREDRADRARSASERAASISSAGHADSLKDLKRTSMYLSSGHVTKSADDLICDIGVSGMTLYPPDTISGITKMRHRYAVPLIALQAICLQVGMLHFLSVQLVPRADTHRNFYDLPIVIVFIAIYLHFLTCISELPYTWILFMHLQDFHEDYSDLVLMGSILILDGFIVPLLSFYLGALYLCTSRTIGDVILNAVAVAFIAIIDNWILALNVRANLVAGKIAGQTVHIPTNKKTMRKFAWTVTFIPVVPMAASALFCFIGFEILNL